MAGLKPFSIVVAAIALTANATFAQTLPDVDVKTLSEGLNSPWGLTELDQGRWLISERPGQLRLWDGNVLSDPIDGPGDVFYRGQGGLLDVVASPDFAENGKVYLSYSQGKRRANRLVLAQAHYDADAQTLSDIKQIFRVTPDKDTPVHFAGRIALMPDGSLLLTSGDGFDYREQAQVVTSGLGKVLHLNADGTPISLSPGQGPKNSLPGMYSYGHRNAQGLVYDRERNLIWSHEHGPAGGDEINIIEAGENYGWPVITRGKDYSGAQITPFTEYPGMRQPFVDWTPSIAPSSMTVYYGGEFPSLNGDLLVTTLKSQELLWVDLDGQEVMGQHSLLPHLKERFRDVEVSASGYIMLLTDSGKLLQLSRKE